MDESKVLTNRLNQLFRFLRATRYRNYMKLCRIYIYMDVVCKGERTRNFDMGIPSLMVQCSKNVILFVRNFISWFLIIISNTI